MGPPFGASSILFPGYASRDQMLGIAFATNKTTFALVHQCNVLPAHMTLRSSPRLTFTDTLYMHQHTLYMHVSKAILHNQMGMKRPSI